MIVSAHIFRSYSMLIFQNPLTKLIFSPNRFGDFGIIQYVYMEIKRNFPKK